MWVMGAWIRAIGIINFNHVNVKLWIRSRLIVTFINIRI